MNPIARKMVDDAKASDRPNAHLLPVAEARENFEATYAGLTKPPVENVVDVTIPVRGGSDIAGRLYLPRTDTTLPLVVYYHGGGWLLGSVNAFDPVTRRLALASGCAVLSVDYRRGPDHRFPTAVNDAVDALAWAREPGNLPVDTAHVAVAGDSAGGNLAAAVANDVRERGLAPLSHQLLIYPVTTCDLSIGFDSGYDGVMLERDEMLWHQENYLPDASWADDPRVSVLSAPVEGVAGATVIIAECDPIRPQGERYIEHLREAGVPVSSYMSPGLIHGFFGLDDVFPTAVEGMDFAADHLRSALFVKEEA